jgi:hypothetical protein
MNSIEVPELFRKPEIASMVNHMLATAERDVVASIADGAKELRKKLT